MTASTFSVPVQLGAAGLHDLTVQALDAAGNVSIPSRLRAFIDLSPPTASIVPVTPTPRQTPVAVVEILFSKALNPATFTHRALSLTRDGVRIPLGRGVTIQAGASGAYLVGGLAALTDATGVYTLSVALGGVQDIAGNAGQGAVSTTWRRAEGSAVQQFSAYAGNYQACSRPISRPTPPPACCTSRSPAPVLLPQRGFTAACRSSSGACSMATANSAAFFGRGAAALSVHLSLVKEAGADAIVGSVSGSAGTGESNRRPSPLQQHRADTLKWEIRGSPDRSRSRRQPDDSAWRWLCRAHGLPERLADRRR